MSIHIRCRECGAEYPVSDEMAGRTVRCKECDARVEVPEDDEPAPRRRSRRRADKSSNTTMILLIVGGVLCVACVLCSGAGVVGYLVLNRVGQAVAAQVNRGMNAALVPPGAGKVIFSQQGVLMPNDPIREGRPHKPFQVNFQQGKTYVIDLQSADMDSYLYVFDPGNFKIAEDDDGGGFPNSRIRLIANRTGAYTIGCASFDRPRPGGSRFTLTVREE